MNLSEYFGQVKGTGILGTTDANGRVDLAIYATPHVVDDDLLAFVMRERLTLQNLKSTLHAAYMFIEEGPGYKGIRLYLTKTREEINQTMVAALRKKHPEMYAEGDDSTKHLVFFRVDYTRPLVGDKPPE